MLLDSDTALNRDSYYEASVLREPPLPALTEDLSADVVVVGGGFAGLSAALELAQRGMSVVLLEADRLCSGASGRNGGQAIAGYASGQGPFEQQLGPQDARLAWDLSLQAIDLIDERISAFSIDCDRVRGYLYVAETAAKARRLESEMNALARNYDFHSEFASGGATRDHIASDRYVASAFERVSGHLHPLKYGLGLARAAQSCGVRMFEHSPVIDIDRGTPLRVRTAQGLVRAGFVLLAGNCTLSEYGPRVAPEITGRVMPVGTYIAGTEPIDPALCRRLIPSNAAVCDNNFVLDYFRFSADHRMLFGGRVSYTTRTPPQLGRLMAQRMARVFPELGAVPIRYLWGGFVDISMNRAPDFGRLGDRIYYLQGFSGHGVALTGLAGRMVAQAMAGQAGHFDVFARLRHANFPGGKWLRTPSLALAMLLYRLRDALPA